MVSHKPDKNQTISYFALTLIVILVVSAFVLCIYEPRLLAAAPENQKLWLHAGVMVSLIFLLVWIALEAAFFILFLRSDFVRVVFAVSLANCAAYLLKMNYEWLSEFTYAAASGFHETSPDMWFTAVVFGPLAIILAVKAICYVAVFRDLALKRVLFAAVFANVSAFLAFIMLTAVRASFLPF